MNSENAEVKVFFSRYEAANATFDVEQIAACYAEVFMFGGPDGVQCVKKEDFLKVLPRLYSRHCMNLNFKTLGILSAIIFSALALASMLALGVVLSSWSVEFPVAFSLPLLSAARAGHKELS